jgi:hypothetical protein
MRRFPLTQSIPTLHFGGGSPRSYQQSDCAYIPTYPLCGMPSRCSASSYPNSTFDSQQYETGPKPDLFQPTVGDTRLKFLFHFPNIRAGTLCALNTSGARYRALHNCARLNRDGQTCRDRDAPYARADFFDESPRFMHAPFPFRAVCPLPLDSAIACHAFRALLAAMVRPLNTEQASTLFSRSLPQNVRK